METSRQSIGVEGEYCAKGVVRNERGVVLVITISMMSFLMVLVSTFTFKALMSIKNVKAAEFNIRNRLQEESSQYDIHALIGGQFADINVRSNLYPATKGGDQSYGVSYTYATTDSDWAGRLYMASGFLDAGITTPASAARDPAPDRSGIDDAFHVKIATQNYTPATAFTASLAASDSLGWVHVYDLSDTYLNNDTPINARFAYLVIDESGKIKPEFLCDPNVPEGTEVRVGRHVSEISLFDIFTDQSLARKLQPDSITGGEMDSSAGWFSYFDIFRTMGENNPGFWETESRVNEVLNTIFPHSMEFEAWFNGDNDKHRFDIERATPGPVAGGFNNQWNEVVVSDIIKPASNFWSSDANGDDVTDSPNFDNSGGIDWFKNGYDNATNNLNLPQVMVVKQTVVNMIDFFDDDNDIAANFQAAPGTIHAATTDWDAATWDPAGTAYPDYCGNEKVPYFNEIKFAVSFDSTSSSIKLEAEVELVYMYDDTDDFDPSGMFLEVNCEVTCDQFPANASTALAAIVVVTQPSQLMPPPPGGGITFPPPGGETTFPNATTPIPIRPLSYAPLGWVAMSPSNVSAIGASTSITNFKIKVKHAVLHDQYGNLWDFAFDTPTESAAVTLEELVGNYISLEVNDPRNNQDTDEWTWSSWALGPNDNGTIGAVNSTCAPDLASATDQDSEPGAIHPWQVSTAFIANRPCETPWELGAVHRAATWQTLRISKYDSTVTINELATNGFGAYSLGDGHLLNQIKLGPQGKIHGRININTYDANILTGLFSGITIGAKYNDWAQGTEITPAGVSTLVAAIRGANGSLGGEPFMFRGQILTVSALTAGESGCGVAQNTDSKKEELIGKFINLITMRQNFFTVIMTSQIIKDMMTGYQGGNRGVYDEGIDEIMAQQRVKAVMARDPITNRVEVVSLEYLE